MSTMLTPDDLTDRRGRWIPDASWPPGRSAPNGLERVRRLLNTINRENGADLLETGACASSWLRTEGYDVPARISSQQAEEVRSLRDLLFCSITDRSSRTADALDLLARRTPVRVSFDPTPGFVPTGPWLDRVLGTLLIETAEAQRTGTWFRLKACQHCRWAFYDHSKNRSATWCSDGACSGRTRSRTYRARQRTGHEHNERVADEPSPSGESIEFRTRGQSQPTPPRTVA